MSAVAILGAERGQRDGSGVRGCTGYGADGVFGRKRWGGEDVVGGAVTLVSGCTEDSEDGFGGHILCVCVCVCVFQLL